MGLLEALLTAAFAASWASMLMGVWGLQGWRKMVRLTAAASAILLLAKLTLDALLRLGLI